ncbi:hypothetical protein MP638_000779 [Amoeboaphelidium occidentale]|nr:hypothetical protein MP638_000779 [Amoeboaphelidium occidentale]
MSLRNRWEIMVAEKCGFCQNMKLTLF